MSADVLSGVQAAAQRLSEHTTIVPEWSGVIKVCSDCGRHGMVFAVGPRYAMVWANREYAIGQIRTGMILADVLDTGVTCGCDGRES